MRHYTRKQAAALVYHLLASAAENASCRVADYPYSYDPKALDDPDVFGSEIAGTICRDDRWDTWLTGPDGTEYRVTVSCPPRKGAPR